jgi:hypothetical protein
MATTSQNTQILNYLQSGQPLTALKALRLFGCMRLASRINDLRKMGHTIFTDMVGENGKTFASYRLAKFVKKK